MNISATLLRAKQTQHTQHINTLQDLIDDSDVIYGTLQVGTITRAFKTTNNTLYQRLWHKMQSFPPGVFTTTNKQGIERVRHSPGGRYAFIMPSDIAEYMSAQAPCDLETFARFLNDRHFALAVPQNSLFLAELNAALLHLEQTGFLHGLYRKWWFDSSPCVVSNSPSRSQLKSSNSNQCYSSCAYLAVLCLLVSRGVLSS